MDATELIRARQSAEEAREFFRVIFEESPLPIILYDPKTLVIERANARACDFYGLRREEIHGSFVSELVAPDEWPRTQEHIARAANAPGVSYVQRTLHRKRDGTLVPVQVAGVNVELEGAKKRIVVLRDLSDIEEATERVRNLYRALDATPTPTVIFDATFTITLANPAFLQFTGLTMEELLGRDFASLLDDVTAHGIVRHRGEFVRGRPLQSDGGLRVKAGELRAVSLTVTPVVEAGDRLSKYFASFREPSAEGAAATQTPAEAALFLDLLAHDVTNYLTAVRGYIELIEASGGLTGGAQRMAQVARLQASHALDLIRDTHRVALLQRDPEQAGAEGDLMKLLDEAVFRIEPLMGSRRFKVRKEYKLPQAPVRTPDLLREVFVNLLHNAVKFDPHDDVILDLSVEKSSVEGKPAFRVRLADRGIGVPDGEKPRLFERGFRPSNAPVRRPEGLTPPGAGVGLSICKFIVERQGGSIAVESRIPGDPSQGSAFVVTLPSA